MTVVTEDDPTEITIPVPCLQYVIGSGAVYVAANATVTDVEALCAVESEGISGAITGRAIYEGSLDFASAQARADELSESD